MRAPRPARGWAVLSGAPEPLNPGSIFLSAPLNFFCAGILKLALGAALDMVEGVVCGAVGAGCWGLWRGCWAGVSGVPWGWVLGAAEGAIGGVVGVPQGEGCWGPRRGRLVGWYGAPWGWVLRAALGAVEEVSGGRGGGCWGPGGGRRRRSAGGRGGRCWEPRRGRAGAPDSEYKHPRPPPHRDELAPGRISSGWLLNTAVCHPDDISYHHMSSGWLSRNRYLIRMSYDNVIMSSGWHRLPFVSHPDEIVNFDFPHHAVALQRFRTLWHQRKTVFIFIWTHAVEVRHKHPSDN